MNKEIVIYQSDDGKTIVDVKVEAETVWLTQQQIAQLFESSRTNIVEHIGNIDAEGELREEATCRDFRQVRKEGQRDVSRELPYYNLDVIISVGYRVKSKTATSFRIWATDVLKQHLIQGYSVNEKRLTQVHKLLQIVSRTEDEMVSGVANVLERYTIGLDLLDDYDYQRVSKPEVKTGGGWKLTYEEARTFVDQMKYMETSGLFAKEKDESFKSSIGAIYQTFDEVDLYPSIQEKAAVLLYLVVKNHSFTDGNKRIAAALFVYFLDKNNALVTESGRQIIANNTLAAITLMIALSKPEEKDVMCALVMNMLRIYE